MTLGEKLSQLRTLEGYARGFDREMTQVEVSKAIREECGGGLSQAYLSQIESGKRRHLTSETRALVARFFRVHPGHLVDDLDDDVAPLPPRQRHVIDVSLVSGFDRINVFDQIFGHGHHVKVHVKHSARVSPFNMAAITAFLTWFGGTGIVLQQVTRFGAASLIGTSAVAGLAGGSVINR